MNMHSIKMINIENIMYKGTFRPVVKEAIKGSYLLEEYT